jgi:hypothetical protein
MLRYAIERLPEPKRQRYLKAKHLALRKHVSVGSLAELEAKLLKAAESLDASKGVNGEQAFARLRKRSKARRENA